MAGGRRCRGPSRVASHPADPLLLPCGCPFPKANLCFTLSAPPAAKRQRLNQSPEPSLFLDLQTFAAFPCINRGIFHHRKASRAEANGINSAAACQEHMAAGEHREEGQCDTGTRWGQSSSITPCQQRQCFSIQMGLSPPSPCAACSDPLVLHPPCNSSPSLPSLLFYLPFSHSCWSSLLLHLPLPHEYSEWEPGFGLVGA